MRCIPYSCTMSEAACAKRHQMAVESWRAETASRVAGRPGGERRADRGEFSACRSCQVGAENARKVGEVMDAT